MTDNTTHHVNESADKITLKTKLTRGTGTRDQEKFDAKVRGDDPDAVAQRMAELVAALDDHDLVETVRATNAEGEE